MAENRHLATRREVGRKHGVAEEPKKVRNWWEELVGNRKKKKSTGARTHTKQHNNKQKQQNAKVQKQINIAAVAGGDGAACVAVVCGSGVQKRLVLCKLTTSSLFGLQSNSQKDQARTLSLPTSWVTNWIHICSLDEKA